MSTLAKDPEYWIANPTEQTPGMRVVEYDGAAYIERVDSDGDSEILVCLLRDQLPAVIDGLQRVLDNV